MRIDRVSTVGAQSSIQRSITTNAEGLRQEGARVRREPGGAQGARGHHGTLPHPASPGLPKLCLEGKSV